MAQVMVNFRIDEEVKKAMEQACREMGLSMSAAFTIFAKKVGKEKRIPFEVTAEPYPSAYRPRQPHRESESEHRKETLVFAHRQDRLERLFSEIRQSLTAIHTAIPSSITGLPMERIRLLCGNELKEKAAENLNSARALISEQNSELLKQKDLSLLDEYIHDLSTIAEELLELEHTLIPVMKTWRDGDGADFGPYVERLTAAGEKLDGLAAVMQRFLCSAACDSGARAVRTRLRQAARPVEAAYVQTALENLEALILRAYDSLEPSLQERLETDYVQTLERTLWELSQAERDGGDVGGKAALCLRVINVLSQVISDNQRARQEWSGRSLEAEVVALERLAAMRGDLAGGIKANF